jgi:hypothetical protein
MQSFFGAVKLQKVLSPGLTDADELGRWCNVSAAAALLYMLSSCKSALDVASACNVAVVVAVWGGFDESVSAVIYKKKL